MVRMEIKKIRLAAFVALLLTGMAVASCTDDDSLPDDPKINEIWFDKETDELKIRFTDGDGDFGLEPDQTDPPFNQLNEDSTDNFYYHNLHIDVFFMEDGAWLPVPLEVGASGFKYRIPDLTPEGQSKQLRVLVAVDFSNANEEIFNITPEIDTLRYSAVLIDRALNESEVVDSPPVVFNN